MSCLSEALEKPYARIRRSVSGAELSTDVDIDGGDNWRHTSSESLGRSRNNNQGLARLADYLNADSRMGGAFRDARNCAAIHREYGPEPDRKRHVHQHRMV